MSTKFSTRSLPLPDGYPAHARFWHPAESRGAVLYFHGIQSHGGWYETSGQKLAEAGFTVLMPDRRGSGLNAPPRGHYDQSEQCLSDTREMLEVLLHETRQKSAHVVGVSWGGKQAVYLAQASPDKVRSVSLICPGLFPRVDLTMAEKFRVGISMINDRERLYDIPLNDARLFTSNPEKIAWVENDPLKLLQVSASFLLASRRLDRMIRECPPDALRAPVHLMLAGQDRIIDNDRTRAWLRTLPSPECRTTEYPTGGHTLEFEPPPTPFFDDFVGWIAERA